MRVLALLACLACALVATLALAQPVDPATGRAAHDDEGDKTLLNLP